MNKLVNRDPRYMAELPDGYEEYIDVTDQFVKSDKMGMYGIAFVGQCLLGGPELHRMIADSHNGYVVLAEDKIYKHITFVRV